MGVNVEGGFDTEEILHTFADEIRNIVLTIKIVKGMKKMIFALVAMVMMTMSANAQSDNKSAQTFNRVASYLELRVNQIEPAKTAMAQFERSMEAYYQLQDVSKGGEAWQKILARHKATMKKVLDKKQYDKYMATLDLTIKNTADRMMDQQQLARK